MNTVMNLFTKILANRLAHLILDMVQPDQVGFVQSREARDNVIRTLDIIHALKSNSTPLMLLSTDAEKAFDRVSWPFIMEVLKQVGLGMKMRTWISTIYSQPSRQIRVNGLLSSHFPISKATRQGCPLSLLIFVLTMNCFCNGLGLMQVLQGLK